uniref:Outer capsid glycoprotein VP7 n=1 Tax=Rotavirus G TaxID=183407 RepID=A0A3G1RPE9_9REOV|nr:MAG: viral structural protein 7 [Rotavirus G]
MMMLLLLAASCSAQLIIKPIVKNNICIAYPSDVHDELNQTVFQVFSKFSGVHVEFSKYEVSGDQDVISMVQQMNINTCPLVAVYIKKSELDFVSFLSAENECQKFEASKIHYVKLDRQSEFFLYATDIKYCPLSDDLIGIMCDSQLHDTYHELSKTTTYDITDIPEFTDNGYLFYSTKYFYICERKGSNEFTEVHYFYENYPSTGTITRAVNWGNVWTNFKKVMQAVYKVLDIFFGKRTVEPRA